MSSNYISVGAMMLLFQGPSWQPRPGRSFRSTYALEAVVRHQSLTDGGSRYRVARLTPRGEHAPDKGHLAAVIVTLL